MSAEIASLEKVREAAAELRGSGINPTADRVITKIGGGSKATVLHHLRVLRMGSEVLDDIPLAVTELIRPAVAAIFGAGRDAEIEKTRAATERMAGLITDLDEQVAELAGQNAELAKQLDDARTRIGFLEEELQRGDTRVAELRAMMSSVPGTSAIGEEVRDALARLEALFSEVGAQGVARKTISLSIKPNPGRRPA